MAIAANQDVFVLPTKFEGSPVSLLEAMSAGLVPVVSRIPGGITDIVNRDIGFIIDVDDNKGFSNAISQLYSDRQLLNKMSRNAREKIECEFDVRNTAKSYHDLFSKYREFYREKKIAKLKVGARLDQPFLPSIFTRFVRSLKK